MLVGLNYLHRELSVIHADLKPENVYCYFWPTDPSKNPMTLVLPSGKEKTVNSNGDFVKNQKKDVPRKVKEVWRRVSFYLCP